MDEKNSSIEEHGFIQIIRGKKKEKKDVLPLQVCFVYI
jgi:hypothetical protein